MRRTERRRVERRRGSGLEKRNPRCHGEEKRENCVRREKGRTRERLEEKYQF